MNMETSEPWAKLRDDEILDALLKCDDLEQDVRRAFESMQAQILMQKYHTLSYRQRSWVNTVYEQLRPDLQQSANLVSSGKVPIPKNMPTFDWEKNRPLKPPGKK